MTALTDRHKMARGTKLTVQHVFDTVQAIETQLESATLDHENMALPRARFRVAINVPVIDSRMFEDAELAPGDYTLGWPFMLPPLQPWLNNNGRFTDIDLMHRLEEVHLSFNQRAEPAALESPWGTTEARIRYDATEALTIKLALVEKTPLYLDANSGTSPTREVWSAKLDPTSFSGKDFRLNPFAWEGLSEQINPYSSYMLLLDAQDLIDGNADVGNQVINCMLSSVQMTLVMSARVRTRRKTADNVSNLPTVHGGGQVGPSISMTTPTGNANLLAEGAGGVQDEIILLDEWLRKRLPGGYRKDANTPPREVLVETACYDVIAIPMLNNLGSDRAWVSKRANFFPWNAGGNVDETVGQEYWHRITYPFVIHHVLAVTNYCRGVSAAAAEAKGAVPSSATLTNTLGVSLITGDRADQQASQQVAYLQWTVANKGNHTVDQLQTQNTQLLTDGDVNFEILQIPLVNNGTAGVGLRNTGGTAISQGTPFFVGKGTSITRTRSNAADHLNNPVAPVTLGCEQFLSVRWTLRDSNGLGGPTLGGGATNDHDVYSGFGGSMVYLICEKNLCGLRYNLSMDQMHPLNR
jgi:hypothetical protein